MKTKNNLIFLVILIFGASIFFSSCNKDDQEEFQPAEVAFSEETFRNELAKELIANGYDETDFKFIEDAVIVEGDIAFPLDELREVYKNKISPESQLKSETQRGYRRTQCSGFWLWEECVTYEPVKDPYISDIKIKVNTTTNILSEINIAIDKWNRTGSKVFMHIVTSGTADLTITQTSEVDGNVIAYSYYGKNGNVGTGIVLRPLYFTRTSSKKIEVLMHELSHSLGIAHTDQLSASYTYHIEGTPTTDNSSVFLSTAHTNTTFTKGDLTAIRRLYPITRTDEKSYIGDVNGDGKDDLIVVGEGGINVGIGTGSSFSELELWHHQFAKNQGWSAIHPIVFGDFNGDGRTDVAGFANGGTVVALSTGNSFISALWTSEFGYSNGWRVDMHPRLVGDFNGDGKDDIVGFSNAGALVAISTGSGFSNSYWLANFGYNQGWRVDMHPRLIGDFNGDGKDDIVGFADAGAYVAISNGASFSAGFWMNDMGRNNGWSVANHPRIIGDFNGDGKDDIAGFANAGTVIAISTGYSFNGSVWMQDMGCDQGWNPSMHPRMVGDFNGDGKDDIVGFAHAGAYMALSSGSTFYRGFWMSGLGYNDGWRVGIHPRMVGNLNNDGKDDIVGLGEYDFIAGVSSGANFIPHVFNDYK